MKEPSISSLIPHPSSLFPDRHAQRSNVTTRIKHSQRYRVFASSQSAEVDGENFVSTIGDTIVRKNRYPCCSIQTRVSLLYFSCEIIDDEYRAGYVSGNLRL